MESIRHPTLIEKQIANRSLGSHSICLKSQTATAVHVYSVVEELRVEDLEPVSPCFPFLLWPPALAFSSFSSSLALLSQTGRKQQSEEKINSGASGYQEIVRLHFGLLWI